MLIFTILYGEVTQTKKGIIGLLKGKSKRKKEIPAEENLSSDETTFQQESQASPNTQNTTCPNNQCGKVFDKPLELIDLADPLGEHSLVCPHCLSKLESVQLKQEEVTEAFPIEESQSEEKQKEENCPHHFGYLAKRPKNVPIPEFCLTCPQMIECCIDKH